MTMIMMLITILLSTDQGVTAFSVPQTASRPSRRSQSWTASGSQIQHRYQVYNDGRRRRLHGDVIPLYGMLPGIISNSNPFLMASAEMAQAAAVGSSSASSSSSSAALWTLFWETVITSSIPALFGLVTIAIAAFVFRPRRGGGGYYDDGDDEFDNEYKRLEESVFGLQNPAAALYEDLYADQDQYAQAWQERRRNSNNQNNNRRGRRGRRGGSKNLLQRIFSFGGGSGSNELPPLPQNVGIPSEQYIKLTNWNRRLDSYQYSVRAATRSKAAAAAYYRQASFQDVWQRVTSSSDGSATAAMNNPTLWLALQDTEKEFLRQGRVLTGQLQALQTRMAQMTLDEELQALGWNRTFDENDDDEDDDDDDDVEDLSTLSSWLLPNSVSNNNSSNTASNGGSNLTSTSGSAAMILPPAKKSWLPDRFGGKGNKKRKLVGAGGTTASSSAAAIQDLWKQIHSIQEELQQLEWQFVQDVMRLVGPQQALAVRTALLGDVAVRGSGSLLRDLSERPLTRLLSSSSSSSSSSNNTAIHADSSTTTSGTLRPTLYVTRFPGDATASQVATLREEVTAIVGHARAGIDEALVVLQSGGGTVTGYGLAAAQLLRFKQAGLKLTVAVEQVAASGGYMMCCVADRIVASPFAVLGSIGVITDIPNVYERLKQEGIEFQTVTAGKFKRTLTPTKKVTKEDFEKTKQDVEEIFYLFRDFVGQHRPQVDLNQVATGEVWFGTAALERKLCDDIQTVDDVLTEYVQDKGYQVFEVEYAPPIETPFGVFQPAAASSSSASAARNLGYLDDDDTAGWLGRGVRWIVRTVAQEIRAELGKEFSSALKNTNVNKPIQERYMMMDDRADRIKSQDYDY